jgi:hypothetical protein
LSEAGAAAQDLYRGRELDDGSGLLDGGGERLRCVRLQAPADVASGSVKRRAST